MVDLQVYGNGTNICFYNREISLMQKYDFCFCYMRSLAALRVYLQWVIYDKY